MWPVSGTDRPLPEGWFWACVRVCFSTPLCSPELCSVSGLGSLGQCPGEASRAAVGPSCRPHTGVCVMAPVHWLPPGPVYPWAHTHGCSVPPGGPSPHHLPWPRLSAGLGGRDFLCPWRPLLSRVALPPHTCPPFRRLGVSARAAGRPAAGFLSRRRPAPPACPRPPASAAVPADQSPFTKRDPVISHFWAASLGPAQVSVDSRRHWLPDHLFY